MASSLLAHPASNITPFGLDDADASDAAPITNAAHDSAIAEGCHASRNREGCLKSVLCHAQRRSSKASPHTLSNIVIAIEHGS